MGLVSRMLGGLVMFGSKSDDPTLSSSVDVTEHAAHVISVDQLPGVGVVMEIANQTTTPTKSLFPSGLLSLNVSFIDRGAAAGTVLYVVFDAPDDAAAITMLGSAGSRHVVRRGGSLERTFSELSKVYRVDIASDVGTETGASLSYLEGKVKA